MFNKRHLQTSHETRFILKELTLLCQINYSTSMTKDKRWIRNYLIIKNNCILVCNVILKFSNKFISKFNVKNFRISPWKNGELPIPMTTYSLMKMKPLRMRMSWCQMQIVNFLLQIQTGKVPAKKSLYLFEFYEVNVKWTSNSYR